MGRELAMRKVEETSRAWNEKLEEGGRAGSQGSNSAVVKNKDVRRRGQSKRGIWMSL